METAVPEGTPTETNRLLRHLPPGARARRRGGLFLQVLHREHHLNPCGVRQTRESLSYTWRTFYFSRQSSPPTCTGRNVSPVALYPAFAANEGITTQPLYNGYTSFIYNFFSGFVAEEKARRGHFVAEEEKRKKERKGTI